MSPFARQLPELHVILLTISYFRDYLKQNIKVNQTNIAVEKYFAAEKYIAKDNNEPNEDTLNESYVEKLINEFQENMKSGRTVGSLENEFNETLSNIRSHIGEHNERSLSNESDEQETESNVDETQGNEINENPPKQCYKLNLRKNSTDEINDDYGTLPCNEDSLNNGNGNGEKQKE